MSNILKKGVKTKTIIKDILGILLMIFSLFVGFRDIILFGNSWIPKNRTEFIYDIVALTTFLIGHFLIKSAKNDQKSDIQSN